MVDNLMKNQQASTKRVYEVRLTDLPVSCPMPDMRVWDAHPRVFLPLEESHREVCPYCDAEFVLIDVDDGN
jgi:uncharacterized Zn-finger protein